MHIYIYIWYHIYPKNAGNLGLHKPERRWHPAKSGIGKIIHTWIHSTKPHNVGQNCILPIYLLYYLQSAATSLQTKPNAYSIAYISPPPPKKKNMFRLDYFSGLGIRHPKKGTPHHISKALRHLRCCFFGFHSVAQLKLGGLRSGQIWCKMVVIGPVEFWYVLIDVWGPLFSEKPRLEWRLTS